MYVLHLRIERPGPPVRIGRLGAFEFPPADYFYVGSALNSLWPRVRRHLHQEGKRHWHVDHLRDVARPLGAWIAITAENRECEVTAALAALPGATRWPPRFGASDCRCPGHLLRLEAAPDPIRLAGLLGDLGLNPASLLPERAPRV
jgi:Uri superfamily endonuclease